LNGNELILDVNANTSITADTDDQIDFRLGGTDRFQMTDTTFSIIVNTTSNALLINQDGNGIGINIDTEATTASALTIACNTLTTANALNMSDADSLTTGTIASFVSNSSDTGTRNLQLLHNDHVDAVNVTPLNIQQDAVTATNFKIIMDMAGFTVFTSDGTTAEGALTGVVGDICLNGGTGNGQMAYCDANGQNWTNM